MLRVHSACALLIFSQETTVSPSFFFLFFDLYWQRNMVGVFADNRTHAPVVEELAFVFTQMQRNFGTTVFLVMSATVYSPSPADSQSMPFSGLSPAARVRTVTLSATINAE
ncbi:hypothetical protein ACLK2B_02500 [Escherichia coli]